MPSCATPTAASAMVAGEYDERVIQETVDELRHRVGGSATLAFVFISEDYREDLYELCELISLHAHVPRVYGCTGAGLAGMGREVENESGCSIVLLNLPGTKVTDVAFPSGEMAEVHDADWWHRKTGVAAGEVDCWIVLADPLKTRVEPWLTGWNKAYPGVPLVGGLASSCQGTDGLTVFANGKVIDGGLAIALTGGARFHVAVSTACRPVGEPLTITAVENNLVRELAFEPAYKVLHDVITAMTEEERERARGNLFAGLAVSEYVEEFQPGDFLVRNIVAADPQTGAVAIGAWPRVGQTLQYQVRDRDLADRELRRVLNDAVAGFGCPPLACLLFLCTGRGKSFFKNSDHDAGLVADLLDQPPMGGFFCNGEFAPVGESNHIHGYTAAMLMIYPLQTDDAESDCPPDGS